jgi:L-ribulokinase
MGTVQRDVYLPDEERARAYDALYAEYVALHDYFGRGGNEVLRRLRRIRGEVPVR